MTSEEEWPLAGDPDDKVGSRHHIVPKFYLERWADARHKIVVVQKSSGKRHQTAAKDAGAERDFYTHVAHDGEFHAHTEQLLGKIEDGAAPVIGNILSAFQVFPPLGGDREQLAMLIAFQMTRGKRVRRSMELQADLITRLQLSMLRPEHHEAYVADKEGVGRPEDVEALRGLIDDLDNYEFGTDPNEHIVLLSKHAVTIFPYLMGLSWYLVDYGGPVLLTCDEPVVLYQHNPSPHGGVGLMTADEIWFPLSPRYLLVLTPIAVGPERVLSDSPENAAMVNNRLVHNAYELVYLHPDHDMLPAQMPPASPLFLVSGGPRPDIFDRYNQPLTDRRTARRGKRPR
ncbi:DUF4238 domain-containing protein [Longispora sp. NPDC051575]|uniref:DUF4238 domain-containing protein n=1 Tax=Longispora sp. NPDC051575 TaxID=3154943 RepID=UPI00342B40C6